MPCERLQSLHKVLRKLFKESVADISSAKLFADFLLFGKCGNINAFYEKFRVKFLTKNFAEIFITLCLIATDIVVDMSGINRKIVFFFQRNKMLNKAVESAPPESATITLSPFQASRIFNGCCNTVKHLGCPFP